MYTAKESREKALNQMSTVVKSELQAVEQGIIKTIEKGELEFYLTTNILEKTKKHLSDLGYKVTSIPDERNGSYIKISW